MAALAGALAEQRDGDPGTAERDWRDGVRERALARRPHEQPPHRIGRFAWLLALLFHLILVIALRVALRQPPGAPAGPDVLRVELLDQPARPPALPSPAPPASMRPAPPMQARRAPPESPRANVPPVEHEPPRLFDEGGAADLPRDIAQQLDRLQPQPDFLAPRIDTSPLLLPRRPLKVRPNHFASAWVGSDGKPLSETIWEPVTFVAEFRAPWGGRYACGWILILFACGDVPDKAWSAPQTWAPASVLDER